MGFSLLERAKEFLRAQRKKKIWYRTMCGLAAVVVFVTTYMLILPAITMERNTICGKEEHTHTDACYEVVTIDHKKVLSCTGESLGIHEHTDTCYDSDHNLICGYADFVVHTHDENCYDEEETLVCALPEIKEHTHTESCYKEEQTLTCGQEDSEGHQHSAECYANERGSLICAVTEHQHSAACYDEEGNLSCTQEVHEHNDNCYQWNPILICGQEVSTGHSHTEACYETVKTRICDELEAVLHTHAEDCFKNGVLSCGKPEVKEHQHTEECFVTEDTETTVKQLVCGMDEHEHTEACYPADDDAAGMPMLLADNTLPVTKMSGVNATYNPITDLYTVSVRLDFQFNSTNGLPTAGTVYTYTYPEGVVVPDEVVARGAMALYDGDKLAGTYQFVKNSDGTYSVQVIFNEKYIDESGDTVTGYVQFEGSFGKEDLNEKGDIVVGADDATILVPGEDITYPDNETESYNIDVSKSGSWVQDGDKLVYTVYVRTTKGTPDPIHLTDIITNTEGLTLGEPSVTVEKGTSRCYKDWQNNWAYTDNGDWTAEDSVTYSYSNGQLDITLLQLSAGEKDSNNNVTAEVYKITYTYPITDQTLESVSPQNTVTVSAEDTTKGQIITDEAEFTVDVQKDLNYKIDKSGAAASDKPGYIKWTVTVNSNEVDITGAKLTDEMLGLVESANDIAMDPTAGASINKDASGKITDITFSACENGMNKNKYTIMYYTPVQESWDGTTMTNEAVLDPDPNETDDEKKASASVTIRGVKLDKSGTFNGNTEKIDWTITVNEGNLDIAGATLTDEMFEALSQNDFTIEPADGYRFITDENGKIRGIAFSALEDGKNQQCYIIKYSTDVTENADGTIDPVTNSALLSPGQGTTGTPVGAESTVTPETVKVTKSGEFDGDHSVNWTITVNEGYRNIAGAVLTDDMFDRLESGTLKVWNENWQELSEGSDQYTISKDASGKITGIVFNAIGETGKNTNKYYVTYSTTEYRQWDDYTVHNEVKLSLDGKEFSGTEDVTVPGNGSVAKSVGNVSVSEDGTTLTIPWTVTLTIPEGGLASGTSIVDDVTKNQNGSSNTNQWMTRSQITAWGTSLTWTDNNGNTVGSAFCPSPELVTFLASDGNTYTYKEISENHTSAEGGQVDFDELKYTLFTIRFPEGLTPPEGAAKLTFTYCTTADVSQTASGQINFYNYVKAGEKETSADYTHYKPGVVKKDGNGKTENTAVANDGTLTWKIEVTMGKGYKKLTLIDTLPEGVTLESLQLTGWGNLNMELIVNDDGTISGTDSTNQYNVSGTLANQVISLNVVPQTEGNAIQTGAVFTLTVNCKVDDAENQTGTIELTNTAQMKLDDVEIGSASQTQEWTYEKEEDVTQVVDKSGRWDNNNRILSYTLILNKDGQNLLDGADTLTLVDILSYTNQFTLYWPISGQYTINASLIQSSVQLYEAVWDEDQQKWVAGEVISNWSWTYEEKTGEHDYDKHNAANTITATGIPDGTPLMFQYSYRITSNAPDEVDGKKLSFDLNFTNEASLKGTGYTGGSSSSNMKWEYSDATAGVTTEKSYIFYKVEAGNYNISLADATFSVYQYDPNTEEYGSDPVKTYATNDSGSFQISRHEKDSNGTITFSYDTNTLYKVVETAPPSGYRLPDVVNSYYFYFSSTEDTTHTLPSGIPLDAVDLSNESKTVYVENVKNATEITVQKIWQDKDGNPVDHNNGSVTIHLYRKTSQGSSSGGGGSESGDPVQVKVGIMDENKSYVYAQDIQGTLGSTETSISVPTGTVVTIELYCPYGTSTDGWAQKWKESSATANGTALTRTEQDGGNTYIFQCTIKEDTTIDVWKNWGNEATATVTFALPTETNAVDTGDSPDSKGTEIGSVTLDKNNGWTHTFTDLPLIGTDANGETVTYYYYVEEISVPNYTTSYDNNDGIQSGTITVTNQAVENPSFELPETGGPGTRMVYTLGSMLMLLASIAFLYIKKKNNGKEGGLS